MQIKQLIADEDAVSPVIGVILMVAITVILAAVIGTFVLGLGENVQDSAPQANFQFEYNDGGDGTFASGANDDELSITHTGGEDVATSEVTVQVGGTEVNASAGATGWSNDPIQTGSSFTYNESTNSVGFQGGDSVRVIWTSPSGGTSNTIGQSTVPS